MYVFGDAGTGKSVLLKMIRNICKQKCLTTLTMATTGMACSLVSGQTIARTFLKAPGTSGRGTFSNVSQVYAAIRSMDDVCDCVPGLVSESDEQLRWTELDVVFIEEISQVDAGMLEFINHFFKKARQRDDAFGGIRIVLFGDFCQLKPLPSASKGGKTYASTGVIAFQHFHVPGDHPSRERSAWRDGRFMPCRLVEQMRANGDAMLQRVAAAARNSVHSAHGDKSFNKWPAEVKDALLKRTFAKTPKEAAHLTHLFFAGEACSSHNAAMSTQLKTSTLKSASITGIIKSTSLSRAPFSLHSECAEDWWGAKVYLEDATANAMWATIKELYPDDPWYGGTCVKVGSRLMVTSNMDFELGLVNGALCTAVANGKRDLGGDDVALIVRTDVRPSNEVALERVSRFQKFQKTSEHDRWSILKDDERPACDAVVAKFEWSFLPVTYGWAVTYSKIQGNTLPAGVVCAVCPGMPANMAYTGITRATRLDHVFIIPDTLYTNPFTGAALLQKSIRADKVCADFMARLEQESCRLHAHEVAEFVAQLKESTPSALPPPPDELRAECIICCSKRPAVRLSCNHAPYCADCDAIASSQPGLGAQSCPLCRRRVTSRLPVLLP